MPNGSSHRPRATILLVIVGLALIAASYLGSGSSRDFSPAASFVGDCRSPTGVGDLAVSQLGSYNHELIQAPDRLQAVRAPTFAGSCSIRVQVDPGDIDSNQTDRAEITGTSTRWHNGEDVWYSLVFMLARGDPLPPMGGWMLVHQFFAQDPVRDVEGGAPPFAIEITSSGEIAADVRGGVKPTAYAPAPRDSVYYIARAPAGVWQILLIHIKWSTGPHGLVNIWYSRAGRPFTATPQVSTSGPNVLTVDGDVLPVYAETGIYRSRMNAIQTVYYAGLTAKPTRRATVAFWARASSHLWPPASLSR